MTTITNNKLTGLGENHPANGPLTTERLTHVRDVLYRNLKYSNGGSMDYIIADAVKAFDELLEMRKAEPVGEVVLGEYDDCGRHPDARVVCIAADGQADWENFRDGTRLYAVPPAPVSIDERAAFNAWNNDENLPIAGVGAKNAAWLAWQARAKLGSPTAPVVPETLPCPVHLEPGLKFGKGVRTQCVLDALRRRADYYAELEAMTPEQRAEHDANIEAFKAMLPQPTPVVPEEATPKNIEMLASARVRNVTFQWDEDERNAAADSWNACRATMLNGGKS
ncbi:Uncharacterised protein [Citrobacter koseri]|nr:hypothetical protein [Citrobacter koseri]SUX61261.1 Uncharacterised protein [Citrobacter koseri]